ncbi:MAG: hypothetical protein R3250_02300 [Melioribacteraceae bacterium]|nr:hypothetical protein [Melioribacteraceae bacterium]
MEIVDKTGQPRSDNDLINARNAIRRELVMLDRLDPILVYYPTIIEAIDELLERRRNENEQRPNSD